MPRIKVQTIINDKNMTQFKFGDRKIILDQFQQKVINADITKNLRIIACAGSGKTTTILCRIKHMIEYHNINPKRILLTTFNIDAANILKDRLNVLLNKKSDVRIGTFDSIAAHFYFKYFKSDNFVGVNEYSNLLLKYLNTDDAKNILDQYDYIFFDEFQDINNIQFDIIKKFIDNGTKLTAIGDDAQNIYQWRGSNISFILNFDTIFNNTETIKLENNYRSTPEIINMASAIIKNNTDQIDKNMFANKNSGDKPLITKYKNQQDQALSIIEQINKLVKADTKLDDIVVISRNNFGLKIFEENLEVYNRDNPEKKRIEYVALISDNDKNGKLNNNGTLCLATIHKIKGCEWQYVFLIDLDDKIFPADCDDIGIQEERRLLYVAVTRAKINLYLSFTTQNICRFIGEISTHLYRFPEYKSTYFELNNKRNLKTKTKVTEIIQILNNEDYEYLRANNIIPNIKPTDLQIHTVNKYNKDILDNNLQADYGIYIDTYISRMFGLLNKKSNGLENILAKCTIYSVELNSQYYNIYIESRLPLYLFIYNFDIQKMMHTIFDMDDNKMKILQIIIKKILIKAKDINVLPYEIYVTKDGFLPSEFDKLMINSYNNYTSPVKISNKDIYNISLCHNIFMNRKRLLYRDCYDMFNKDNKIYDDIQIFCSKYCNNNISIKKIIQDKNRLICGELDMYDATEEKIIDFKTSTSNNIQIEWILQLLTYTALMRLENKLIVKYISIYNPINGIETIINIENWNKETELLDYLKKVRDGKEKPLQKKETIKKIDKNKYKEKRDVILNNIDGMDDETMVEYMKLKNKIN